ncbi:penicillin-binding protein 2 [Aerococcaceae bacterium NML190938]|nr:penicillin-binding protein 2 [Aerococcaceae bacterium NML190938]
MMQGTNDRGFIKWLVVFTLVCAMIVAGRLWKLSVWKKVNNRDLVEYAEKNFGGSGITEARRGTIYDANESPIAMDTTSYVMYAILQHDIDTANIVKDPDRTARVLSQYIDATHDEILELLLTPEAREVQFRHISPISPETKKAIEQEDLPGIVLVSKTLRHYIDSVFASHLIGYAVPGEDNFIQASVLEGQLGLEYAYDKVLNGSEMYTDRPDSTIISGRNLYLTLDSRLQNHLEVLMNEYQARYHPQAMNAYLVEAKTGKLLAASQRPSFNLNTRIGISEQWRNLMIEEAYEPGSTIKTLTTAVAYDRGVFGVGEWFQSGSIEVYDQVVKDHNEVGWGTITFEEGFARSSNVAMVNLVQRMGSKQWADKLLEFGFGQSTEFGLANETEGTLAFDNPVSEIMSGFGQGFSATPIQLLQAFSAIVNQGKMMKVQVVNGIGANHQYQPQVVGQPISEQAAQRVLQLMIDTVEQPYGTAQPFRNPNVRVAAKTGTAQIANPAGAGYLNGPDDYYHSAIIFFPAEQPQYMMYVSMKQPQNTGGRLGSQILGELFNRYLDTMMIN